MASVPTQHNDNWRTGVNRAETILTISAVQTQFHKMFEIEVDPTSGGGPSLWASQIVAQPLFASNMRWNDGTIKDIVLVCTMHGTVYAYDATDNCALLWAKWLGQPVLDLLDLNGNINDCKDIHGTNPEWGILSTPVIDQNRQCVYVVMWHNENGGTYKLHKRDLLTGDSIGEVIIAGKAPDAPYPTFDPIFQKQRPGLLLLRPEDLPQGQQDRVGSEGTIYIGFGASIESAVFHGWVLAYDGAILTQKAIWCSTPSGNQGGIWQAGAGMCADEEGNVYVMTGNGDFGSNNFGNSFVKLSCDTLSVLSSFTPWNWSALNPVDEDLGSSGPVSIPGTSYIIGAGKEGILYSLNRSNLGGVTATAPNNIVDEVQATYNPPNPNPDPDHHIHGAAVYFEPLSQIYLWGENDVLKAFTIDRATGRLSKTPVASSTLVAPNGMPGGMLSLSANDTADAIIWALLPLQVGIADENANRQICVDGVLRAFNAISLNEIWNSSSAADSLGHFAKFVSPTIAKGRVYAPTYDGKFVVYGLDKAMPDRFVNRTCITLGVVEPNCK